MTCLRELHLYFLRTTPALAASVAGLAPLLPSFRLLVLRPVLSIGQRVSVDSMLQILGCTPPQVRLQLLLKPNGLSRDDEGYIDEARRAFAEFNASLPLQRFKKRGRLSVRMCVTPAPVVAPKPPRRK